MNITNIQLVNDGIWKTSHGVNLSGSIIVVSQIYIGKVIIIKRAKGQLC